MSTPLSQSEAFSAVRVTMSAAAIAIHLTASEKEDRSKGVRTGMTVFVVARLFFLSCDLLS